MPAECTWNAKTGDLSFKFSGEQKEIFAQIAEFQDVFNNTECGLCGGDQIRFVVRGAKTKQGKDVEYYEIRCVDRGCRARLSFGQSLDLKTIFPKRKDDEGGYLPNNGWTVYQSPTEAAPPPPRRQEPAPKGFGGFNSPPAQPARSAGGGPPPHAPIDDSEVPF